MQFGCLIGKEKAPSRELMLVIDWLRNSVFEMGPRKQSPSGFESCVPNCTKICCSEHQRTVGICCKLVAYRYFICRSNLIMKSN